MHLLQKPALLGQSNLQSPDSNEQKASDALLMSSPNARKGT